MFSGSSGVLSFSNFVFRPSDGVPPARTYSGVFEKTNFVFCIFCFIFLNSLIFLNCQNFLSILNFQNFLNCQTISNIQSLWKTSQTYCQNNQNCLKTSQIVRKFKLYLFLILRLTPWNVPWYNSCTWGFPRSNYYTTYRPKSQASRKCCNIQTI